MNADDRPTSTEAPLPEVGVFYRQPYTERQRRRWLCMLELLHTQQVLTYQHFMRLLAEHGHPVSRTVFRRDLDLLRIEKIGGVYMQTSPDGHVELMALLRQRLVVVCERIIDAPPNLVVLHLNTGSASWLAAVIKEIDEEDVISLMWQDDAVWLLTPPGQSSTVHQRYVNRWRGTDLERHG